MIEINNKKEFKNMKSNVLGNWIIRNKLKTRYKKKLNINLIQIPYDEIDDWIKFATEKGY